MKQQQTLNRLAAASAAAFAAAGLGFIPLSIDRFSNLGVVKFTAAATLLPAGCLWLGACALIGARPGPGRLTRRDPAFRALGAVAASNVLATVCSLSPAASVWGLGGYYGGCVLALLTAAAYAALRAYARPADQDGLFLGMGVTAAVVTVLYLLNIFNIDPIGTYADTAVVERAQFFSTLGQKDFNASFLALTLPPVFWAFLTARGPRRTAVFGLPAVFGALALAVVDSEGLLLGLTAAVLVLLCSRAFTTRVLGRMAFLGGWFFVWAGRMDHLRRTVYTQGGTPLLAGLGRAAPAGLAVCAVLWAGLWALERFVWRRAVPLYRAGRVLTVLLLAGGTALMLAANLWPGFPSLGVLDGYLVFNDDWGTYRGTGWRAAWGAWADGSLWRRLVGVGPGMMHQAVARWAGDALTPRMATFYAAHNEYLELLLTTGLLGLGAWVWFCAVHLRLAARGWQRPGVAPLTLALVSYLAQAAVSIRVSMVFPGVMVCFALLAVCAAAPDAPPPPADHCGAAPGRKARRKEAGLAAPAPAPRAGGRARYWAAVTAAAAAAMALSAALSRVVYGFLFTV